MKSKNILIVEDDESLRRILEYNLEEEGYSVLSASSGSEGLSIFKNNRIALVITDLQMPEIDGIELIRRIRALSPDAIVIVITAFGTVETAVEAMKLGAFEYIAKPFNRDELKMIVRKALDVGDLMDENRYLREMVRDKYSFENMVGSSPKMEDIYKLASQVAKSDATVMILGESGTGKELLARGIHINSPRKDLPFVTVNCGALPENLIESELFGHKKGSFTGAVSDKKGKFEIADGGTLLLDEVGELQPHLQVRLLRVLQDGAVDKIGETTPLRVDVRIISATNRDLEEELKNGNFREDLYYRLCVVPLKLPPLRERKDDIPLLTKHFLNKYSKKLSIRKTVIDKAVIKALMSHNWPGNVRELENAIERMVVMNQDGVITAADIPENIKIKALRTGRLAINLPDEGIRLDELERDIIVSAIEKCNFNQSKTARFLGITRNTLLYRIGKFGLNK